MKCNRNYVNLCNLKYVHSLLCELLNSAYFGNIMSLLLDILLTINKNSCIIYGHNYNYIIF